MRLDWSRPDHVKPIAFFHLVLSASTARTGQVAERVQGNPLPMMPFLTMRCGTVERLTASASDPALFLPS